MTSKKKNKKGIKSNKDTSLSSSDKKLNSKIVFIDEGDFKNSYSLIAK